MAATELGEAQTKKRLDPTTLLLLGLVIVFAFSFLNSPGTDDTYIWIGWTDQTNKHGLIEGYRNAQSDYPPLSFALLSATERASDTLNINGRTGTKLALFLALLATLIIFLAYTKDALLTALLGLSLILSSVALAYLDIFYAPLLVMALWALHKGRLTLFAVCYTLACFTKWQPIIVAPFLAVYLFATYEASVIRHSSLITRSISRIKAILRLSILLRVIAPVVVVVGAVLLVFGAPPVLDSLWKALSYPVLSAQGLNANWILTYVLNIFDPATYAPLSNGMPSLIVEQQGFVAGLPRLIYWPVLLAALVLWFRAAKTFENLLLILLLGYVTHFTFAVGAHENHLFIAVIIAALLASLNRRYLPLFATWSLVANANLFIFYGVDGQGLPFSRVIAGFDMTILLAAINLALFVHLLVVVVRQQLVTSDERRDSIITRHSW